MKKSTAIAELSLFLLFLLSGCGTIGDKAASLSVIYIATTLISLIILLTYCCVIKKRDIWFLLLFSMITVVNTGYLALSISGSLEEALLANRISYLGSVFLPFSMLFIILNVCGYKYKKWLPIILGAVSLLMFFIAASPGYLDIYYKEVSLNTVGGITVLEKVYGPWHRLYLFYLAAYFISTVTCTFCATAKKQIATARQAVVLSVAVMVNIGVWLIEQLVKFDFEFLSVSYIISELFLLSLCFMLQSENPSEAEKLKDTPSPLPATEDNPSEKSEDITEKEDKKVTEQCEYFSARIKTLTPTEKTIFTLYLEGRSTKEVLEELNIKENTLKYHNKNIYGKLGVSSRKQLLELASHIKAEN